MKTILIVEDDEVGRLILKVNLTKNNYKVIEAKNGEEGLEIFIENQNTIDVVVSDVRMPIINGFDMLHTIRKINNKVRLIIISAGEEFEHCGLCPYLSKPINTKELIRLIEGN